MNRFAFRDLTNSSCNLNQMDLKRKSLANNLNLNSIRNEQENIEQSICRVKRLRLSDITSTDNSFSTFFTENTKSITDSFINRLKSNLNEDTSDSGLGTETVSVSNLNQDSDLETDDLFDLDEEESNDCFKTNKNRLLDLSTNSIQSPSPLSNSFQARRCLFKNSPTPQSNQCSKLNLSTPNRVLLKSETSTCAKIEQTYKQITPISSFRNNSIIINESTEQNLDFSFEQTIQIKKVITKKQEDDEESKDMKDIHQMIMQSLDYECSQTSTTLNSRLIGDRSRYHLLPCKTTIKHSDLNVITPATFKQVLDGSYDNEIGKLIIIDARYPYEFDGGHIRNAQNIYTREKIIEMFLENRESLIKDCDPNKRLIIVFHCEFSSERGPSMLRFLRNQDRLINKDSYPKLFYPELYLLEGGYKAFYEKKFDYCEPKMYKPMLHEDHVQDLKHFRSKAKTWELNNKQMGSITSSSYKSVKSSRVVSMTSRFQRFQSNLF